LARLHLIGGGCWLLRYLPSNSSSKLTVIKSLPWSQLLKEQLHVLHLGRTHVPNVTVFKALLEFSWTLVGDLTEALTKELMEIFIRVFFHLIVYLFRYLVGACLELLPHQICLRVITTKN